MSKIGRLNKAVTDPVIPYNSLYIDIPLKDAFKALRTPGILGSMDCFNPKAYNPETVCFGCRVRQIYGITTDASSQVFESVNDVHQRLSKLSWSKTYSQEENMNSIHYDIASLWARPWINNTLEYKSTAQSTKDLQRTNPLCSHCTLTLHQGPPQAVPSAAGIPAGLKGDFTIPGTTPISPQTQQTSFPAAIPKYQPPPHAYNVVQTLSVRSALSAWLLFKDYPKGNIVLFSSINIPDMARVIRAHDLIPLPIDLDTNTTMINMEILQRTIDHYGSYQQEYPSTPTDHPITHPFGQSPKTVSAQPVDPATGRVIKPKICAVILSYIWGIRNDIAPQVELCNKFNIPCIEDCAEAYTEANFTGHPDADMSLFSFGSIKNATSFGGGIARIKSFEDYYGVLIQQSLWPRFTNQQYYEKVRKMLPLALALNSPIAGNLTTRAAKLLGIDVKELVVANLRGFPGDMIIGIRHQPSQALTYMLRHRIAHATTENLSLASQKGFQFEQLLTKNGAYIEMVGKYAEKRGYWLFPFIVTDPVAITDKLTDAGVQIYRGATQLQCLQLPTELDQQTVVKNTQTTNQSFPMPYPIIYAQQVMDHVIYVPLNKYIPYSAMEAMAKECAVACGTKEALGTQNKSIIDYPPLRPQDLPNLSASQIPVAIAPAKL